MGLVEDDAPLISVAPVVVLAVGEPSHDLVEARRLALPGRRAQRGIGGEEDSLRMGDVGPLAHLAEGDDVVFVSADGAPVAPRVLKQLVDCESQRGALSAPQPLVEDDGGHLPALAAAGAVAQHPAAPEADRIGQRFVGIEPIRLSSSEAGAASSLLSSLSASTRFTVSQPAPMRYFGGEMTLVRLAGEDHALELGVGQQPLGHHALGQQWVVGRHGVRHRSHGARLHQRRRVLDRPRHVDA